MSGSGTFAASSCDDWGTVSPPSPQPWQSQPWSTHSPPPSTFSWTTLPPSPPAAPSFQPTSSYAPPTLSWTNRPISPPTPTLSWTQKQISPPPAPTISWNNQPIPPPPAPTMSRNNQPISPPPASTLSWTNQPISPPPASTLSWTNQPIPPPPAPTMSRNNQPISPPPASTLSWTNQPISPPPASTLSWTSQPISPPPAPTLSWTAQAPPASFNTNLSSSTWNLSPPARSAPAPPSGPTKCRSMTDILSLSSRGGSLPRKLAPPPSTPRTSRRYGLLPPPPPDIQAPARPSILTLPLKQPTTLPRTNPYFSPKSPKSPLSPGYSKISDFSQSSINLTSSQEEYPLAGSSGCSLNRSSTHQSLAAVNIAPTNSLPNTTHNPHATSSFEIKKEFSLTYNQDTIPSQPEIQRPRSLGTSLNPFVLTQPKVEQTPGLNPFRVPLSHMPSLDPRDRTKEIGEEFFNGLVVDVVSSPCCVTNPNVSDPLTQPQPSTTLPPIRKSSQVS